ncbi:MAG: M28 family peptidase [Acidobacteria bacterium]|nr:M28 family peptidase [Acidobacteriota bacterium]
MKRRLGILVCSLMACCAAAAQTSPFLPEDLYQKLDNEVSGDRAYDHLRNLTQYHSPHGAERDFKLEAQWVAQKAREAGLEDVVFHELPYDGVGWSPLAGEAWLLEPGPDGKMTEVKLGNFAEVATTIADYSRSSNVEADLVDVGLGTKDEDYAGKDVKEKIVLASGKPKDVETEAVWKRGALGILSYYSSRATPSDYPDQVAWSSIHDKAGTEGKEPAFAFMVSWRTGTLLRQKLSGRWQEHFLAEEDSAKPQPPPRLRVRLRIESEIVPNPTHGLVEGWIRGASLPGQQVVLTAHLQEERFSANDDRSGCANLLEIGRALMQLIREGKLERPARDLRFWWVNEFDSQWSWFSLHPEDRKNIFVDINQDMVGAHHTRGGLTRVQHVTRTPWSRPTFFNDVVESVIMALAEGNNSYLAAQQAEHAAPGWSYTRPLVSRLGSRDRYAVEVVPYFANTDHHPFNDMAIGAAHGGVTFTNWPDEYIHSSDDDLWRIDRTTLKRNAVAVSALALFMASAGPQDVFRVAPLMVPGSVSRIFSDHRAVSRLELAGKTNLCDLQNAAAASLERELAAIHSLKTLAAGDARAGEGVEAARKVVASAAAGLQPTTCEPVSGKLAEEMRALKAKIPVRIESVADYVKKKEDVKAVPKFHPLMRFEALNFADGKRSMWDIYRTVRAEAQAAGEWYYGDVTTEMVQQYFEKAATAGIVTVKDAPPPEKVKRKRVNTRKQ